MESVEERRARNTRNTRNYRARHPQRIKESRTKIYINRKRRSFEMLGGAFCCECGCDELSFLEINHIGGGGAKEWKSRRAALHDDLLSGKRSVEGLNVLCRVCNAIEFLLRKNPHAAGRFVARWEKYTGLKSLLITGSTQDAKI